MKPWTVAVFAFGVAAALPCAADTLDAESRIVAVTVFPDRAGVTRRAALRLTKGPHNVKVAPLPSFVEPESISAKGSGEAQVTLTGVRLVTTQLAQAQAPKVQTLEQEIRKTTQRQQHLRDVKRVLEQERTYLASIQAASSEQIGKDLVTKSPSASDAASLLTFLDEAFLKNADRDQEAGTELEELARTLDKLQRELAELTQGGAKQETAILVELDAHDGGPFTLKVSYRVPGASWQPTYEARAATNSDNIELASYALIRQRTGEDWNDVQLTLSTARPAIAGSMPELQPWFLRPWEQVYARTLASKISMSGTAGLLASDEEKKAEEPQRRDWFANAPSREADVAVATVESQGPAVTFRLSEPATIPGDWQPHKVPISSNSLAAQFAYETTPRLLAYAFLRAKVTNTTDALYLAGPVSVFLDGGFVATAALKQVAPAETFDLYLGADERVKIKRQPLKERVEVSLLPGLRGKTKSTDYEFLTTIENYTGRRIAVTAFDQIPVSDREEIIVESVKYVPAEMEKDSEKPGLFHWLLDLAPNQKQELRLSYRIRHPVDMQIQ